jgi:hypothetical protein
LLTKRKRENGNVFDNQSGRDLTKPEKVFFFQLFALIKPLIILLQHTIEKQERLPLFKVIWGTLNRLLSKFPDQMHINTDPISIMMPIF